MKIQLTSGRHVYANFGIFGIDEDFEVTEGYDSAVTWPVNEAERDPTDLTADDMIEIADIMIDRWTRFKESLNKKED